jgi:hypothetical protein
MVAISIFPAKNVVISTLDLFYTTLRISTSAPHLEIYSQSISPSAKAFKNLLPFIGRIDKELSRNSALYFAPHSLKKQQYQGCYQGFFSCFEAKLTKAP